MGTKMGYAPGTRIQIRDNSAYQVVQNPNTVAGIVGYASKGELNKIIPVANTGELGVKLGYGYQSYKYNQGMYAANAVLTTGGEVEYVRPYGEEISRTDPYKRDLKTDAFVVAFDKNAALYDNNAVALPSTSFNVKHFASTRFKTDGAAEFGVTRKINNIAETIARGSNVMFNVDAGDNFADSNAARKFDNNHCTDMVLFAIMNRDPSYANRAYDRYEVVSGEAIPGSNRFKCLLSTRPIFVAGDKVLIPNTSMKMDKYGNKGTSPTSMEATVVAVDDKDVIIEFPENEQWTSTKAPDVLIFSDTANAVADGFDYMTIKTAVAGNSVKNLSVIKFGSEGNRPSDVIKDGTLLQFADKNGIPYFVRLVGAALPSCDECGLTIKADSIELTGIDDASLYFVVGDKITVSFSIESTNYSATLEIQDIDTDTDTIVVVRPETIPAEPTTVETATIDEVQFVNAATSGVYMADISGITENDTWSFVVKQITKVLQSAKQYSVVPYTNDIISTTSNASVTTFTVDPSATYDYSIGDLVAIVRNDNDFTAVADARAKAYNGKVYPITSINAMAGKITVTDVDGVANTLTSGVKYQLLNLTMSSGTVYTVDSTYTDNSETYDYADMYLVSSYTMFVSKLDQAKAPFGENSGTAIATDIDFVDTANSVFTPVVEKSDTVLANSDIGASFLSLGLAKSSYIDINFDGNKVQTFTLNDAGIAVARMFLSITYRFNGKIYEFEGTIVPFNYNNRQLSIGVAAEYELENSGLEFVINDSGVLDYFLENNSYDLSQTVVNGVLNGSYTTIAYNEDDPAIRNDAVWSYDPQNNNNGSTISTAWNLFVNKDASDVDMLVSAGMAITGAFSRTNELLNEQVMQAMINVCENRKDCFCIFDGVYEPDIEKAVSKMTGAGHLSLGRWGALYDGRGVFTDSLYTQSPVDVMKSVQLAAIITANRQSGVFWEPPSGDKAYVPSAWGTKEKFVRSYNAEDKGCDHAKLSDIHVNATRVNRDGIRIWGDFTLQMEDTAFNQIHVTMLVAGIHKMFYKYLDHKVFKLNTTTLRAQITSDLQEKLNNIKRQNPSGLIEGKVICDDTNNTPDLVNQNFLIVDLKLLPPKSTRWIILRTSVESLKNGKNITTDILQV